MSDDRWTPPPVETRADEYQCLLWHRGRWRHVAWNKAHSLWQFGYASAMTYDGPQRSFAPLPDNTPEHNFYEGEKS